MTSYIGHGFNLAPRLPAERLDDQKAAVGRPL